MVKGTPGKHAIAIAIYNMQFTNAMYRSVTHRGPFAIDIFKLILIDVVFFFIKFQVCSIWFNAPHGSDNGFASNRWQWTNDAYFPDTYVSLSLNDLTHWRIGMDAYICISRLGKEMASHILSAKHHLDQWCLIVKQTFRGKFERNLKSNINVFFHENAIQKGVCKNVGHFVLALTHRSWDKMATITQLLNH